MAAHRYWRAKNFVAYGGGDLEMSAFYLLLGGTRVDSAATLSASLPPSVGAAANLKDGDTATYAAWVFNDAKRLVLVWDFGTSSDVDDIRIGYVSDPRKFPLGVSVEYSDDGVTWTTYASAAGITRPAALGLTQSNQPYPLYDTALGMLLHFDSFSDSGPNQLAFTNTSLSIDFVDAVFGGRSALNTSGSGLLRSTDIAKIACTGAIPWTWECWVKPTSFSGGGVLIDTSTAGSNTTGWQVFLGASGDLNVYSGAQGKAYGSSATLVLNQWQALRVCWDGALLYFFVNGVLTHTSAGDTPAFSNVWGTTLTVMNSAFGNQGFQGRMDECRFTMGVCLSTSSYVVSTSPFPDGKLGIQCNRVKGSVAAQPVLGLPGATPDSYGDVLVMRKPGGIRGDYLTGVVGQGIGRVKGTIKIDDTPIDTPVRRRVRLIRERDGLLLREQWSNAATGAYDFQYVDELQTYTVLSYDYLANFRAVVADRIVPELMP